MSYCRFLPEEIRRFRVLLFVATIILLPQGAVRGAEDEAAGTSGPEVSSPSDLIEASTGATRDLILKHVNVVPMDSPRVLRDRVVLIRDGLIHAIGSPDEVEIPIDAHVIDGENRYLLPGLTDAHVHLEESLGSRPDFGDAPLFFAAGITSVLNLRGDEVALNWRRRIEAGELIAPTLYSSGEFLNEPYVTSPDEVAQEVVRQAEAGFDVIKFHESFFGEGTTVGLSREAYNRMMKTAKDIGVPLVGHTPHNLGLTAVLEEGQSLAHVNCLLEYDLLPDPTARFQAYARATKWSCLAVIALAVVILLWGLVSPRRTLSVTVPALASLAVSGAFLYVWEQTFWAGDELLIFLLFVFGLALLALAATCALAILRRSSPRGLRTSLAVLFVPLIALLFTLSYWLPLAWRGTDRQLEKLAAALAESEISVITTVIVDSGVTPDRFEPWYRYLPEEAQWLSKPFVFERPSLFEPSLDVARWTPLLKKVVNKLQDAGVPLLAGTDAGGLRLMVGGITLHRELELLLESGLTPYQALRTATAAPAIFLHRETEFGTIALGSRADLLLVDGNPLEGLATLREPRGLCVRGRWFSAERLDRMLAALENTSLSEPRSNP
ncbi:MAG: amidohydrolase family protein [Acidobacteriota bacterium]|nr:amidohydrolase family protein [Acidobacteriota bacterium]